MNVPPAGQAYFPEGDTLLLLLLSGRKSLLVNSLVQHLLENQSMKQPHSRASAHQGSLSPVLSQLLMGQPCPRHSSSQYWAPCLDS